MYDAYVIICHPFNGYGIPYVWSVYRHEKNARKEYEELVKKYNLFKDDVVPDKAYNFHTPSIKNRYEMFEIEEYYFED